MRWLCNWLIRVPHEGDGQTSSWVGRSCVWVSCACLCGQQRTWHCGSSLGDVAVLRGRCPVGDL